MREIGNRYLQMHRIVVQKRYSPSFSVAGIRLPLEGHHQVVIATIRGKESSRMKNRAESTPSRTKEHFSPWQKLAAIGALSSVALTGCATQNVSAEPGPSSSTSASEAPTPTPTETAASQAEVDAKIKKLEIPAGLEPEALGAAIIDRLNQWSNEGADASAKAKLIDDAPTDETIEETAQRLAQQNAELYAVALFGEDYATNPSTSVYVKKSITTNASTLAAYGQTAWNDQWRQPDGSPSEGYKYWKDIIEGSVAITAHDDAAGTTTYNFVYENASNAGRNNVKDTFTKGGMMNVVVTQSDGHVVITNIDDWAQ